jgi:hypothetical protein
MEELSSEASSEGQGHLLGGGGEERMRNLLAASNCGVSSK